MTSETTKPEDEFNLPANREYVEGINPEGFDIDIRNKILQDAEGVMYLYDRNMRNWVVKFTNEPKWFQNSVTVEHSVVRHWCESGSLEMVGYFRRSEITPEQVFKSQKELHAATYGLNNPSYTTESVNFTKEQLG